VTHRTALTAVIFWGALVALTGCLSTVHLGGESTDGRVRVLRADRETVWSALLRVLDERNIQLLESDRDRGWLHTDFIYFRPMAFGEPVLAGKMMMGDYVDVEGGRYRLTVQLTAAGAATSVRVEAEVQRLEKRTGAPPVEPSFSLDASASRGYVVGVPQPSNGVIERRFLADVEEAVAGSGAPRETPRPPGQQESD